MSVTRPTIISLSDLEQAARKASLLALDDREAAAVSGGALSIREPLLPPLTTMGMMPPQEPTDPIFSTVSL